MVSVSLVLIMRAVASSIIKSFTVGFRKACHLYFGGVTILVVDLTDGMDGGDECVAGMEREWGSLVEVHGMMVEMSASNGDDGG